MNFLYNNKSQPNNEMQDFTRYLEQLQDKLPSLSDEEWLFSNLIMKTDFSKSEITEIMEWNPTEDQQERISSYVDYMESVQEDSQNSLANTNQIF